MMTLLDDRGCGSESASLLALLSGGADFFKITS
jgi:hypothetical protein